MNALSRRACLLLMVAAIFLALGLLTGMLGANLGQSAVAPYPWSYLMVCAAAALVLAAPTWSLGRRQLR